MTLVSTVLLAAATQLMAQSVTSGSIGFNKVTCLSNSDTIVGVPFRAQGSRNTKLAAAPVVNGDVATLTLTATHLPLWPTHSRYVKFNSGGNLFCPWWHLETDKWGCRRSRCRGHPGRGSFRDQKIPNP